MTDERRALIDEILALDIPVDDWEILEAEIINARCEDAELDSEPA